MAENEEKEISFKDGQEEVTITSEKGKVLSDEEAREFLAKLQKGVFYFSG
ncbi:unnamed protein product [marine sediment metagenome]|uniref:Uncharacterized protein n=1 Tax=marine sediment metagenome TaxID=412755 RepID=X1ICD8_9ZZZZ